MICKKKTLTKIVICRCPQTSFFETLTLTKFPTTHRATFYQPTQGGIILGGVRKFIKFVVSILNVSFDNIGHQKLLNILFYTSCVFLEQILNGLLQYIQQNTENNFTKSQASFIWLAHLECQHLSHRFF